MTPQLHTCLKGIPAVLLTPPVFRLDVPVLSMLPGLHVRDYENTDLPAVLEIAISAWTPVFASYRELLGDDLFYLIFPDWSTEKANHISNACAGAHGARVLIAEIENKPAGFIVYYPSQGYGTDGAAPAVPPPAIISIMNAAALRDCNAVVGEISSCAVAPAYQRQGIGTRLYIAAMENMRQEGVKFAKVTAGTAAAQEAVRHILADAGFSASPPGSDYVRLV